MIVMSHDLQKGDMIPLVIGVDGDGFDDVMFVECVHWLDSHVEITGECLLASRSAVVPVSFNVQMDVINA